MDGFSDLVVDNIEQISILEEAPWDSINPEAHWVEVGLPELTSGFSRGVSTRGTVVSVREDSGIIEESRM